MTSTQTAAAGATTGEDSFAALFEASLGQTDGLKEGDIVSGHVIKVNRDTVIVDIGYKSEGVIPASEFIDTSGKVNVSPGDRVDVLIEAKENDQGLVALSKEKADKLKVWDEISAACERDELIAGTITARVKGGLQVSIRGGVKAFLPGSQVDLRPVRNLDKLIGQTYQFKVIKFNKKRGNIVLSRRVLLEKERDEQKTKTLEKGIGIRSGGRKVKFTVKLSKGVPTISFKSSVRTASLSIGTPAISVSGSEASKIRNHKVKKLTVSLKTTDTSHKTVKLGLTLKKLS